MDISQLEIQSGFDIFQERNEMTEVAVGVLKKDNRILICQRKEGGSDARRDRQPVVAV